MKIFIYCLFTILSFQLLASENSGVSKNHIEYIAGDLPIIISAPHGGRIKDKSIADRKSGTLMSDANTDKLAKRLYEAFEKTGKTPYLVICHLHRVKVDCNRNEKECSDGDLKALVVWREFQQCIENAKRAIRSKGQKVLFIDLHGHAHKIPRLEFGYLLNPKDLFEKGELFNELESKSSLMGLVEKEKFEMLLRGPKALGTLLSKEGFPSVPSANMPDAGKGNKYFRGGYNTVRHGAQNSDNCYSIQIEMNKPGVRDTAENRQRFAAALCRSLMKFYSSFLE